MERFFFKIKFKKSYVESHGIGCSSYAMDAFEYYEAEDANGKRRLYVKRKNESEPVFSTGVENIESITHIKI